jgi:hypothetical protein
MVSSDELLATHSEAKVEITCHGTGSKGERYNSNEDLP